MEEIFVLDPLALFSSSSLEWSMNLIRGEYEFACHSVFHPRDGYITIKLDNQIIGIFDCSMNSVSFCIRNEDKVHFKIQISRGQWDNSNLICFTLERKS